MRTTHASTKCLTGNVRVQCTTKNVKDTSLLKLYKTVEKIVTQIQQILKGRCSEISVKSCSAVNVK